MRYLGVEMLDTIQNAYAEGLGLAQQRGYDREGDKYHWLYEELRTRLEAIDQVKRFIKALPLFMSENDAERPLTYVVSYSVEFFTEDRIGKAAFPKEEGTSYFRDGNPYLEDMNAVLNEFNDKYKFEITPLFYVDLCEYLVRVVRLYLYIREQEFHAIDRANFAQLMQLDRVRHKQENTEVVA